MYIRGGYQDGEGEERREIAGEAVRERDTFRFSNAKREVGVVMVDRL